MKPFFIKLILLLMIVSVMTVALSVFSPRPVVPTDAEVNADGELVLYYSDGSQKNLGKVEGKQGESGEKGSAGSIGESGADGKDGEITIVTDSSSIPFATAKAIRSVVSIMCTYEQSTTSSAGSGVIYQYDKSKGEAFIITNYHVVFNEQTGKISDDINVHLYSSDYTDNYITAEYVGGSPTNDIAVLHVTNSRILMESDCTAATLADSEKQPIGSTAIAIGNPARMGISASCGIISVDSEYINMSSVNGMDKVQLRVMRIDTAVNSGNSGGGLYNASGELIGIVTAKSSLDSTENIAYAIPSNLAIAIADNIYRNCYQTTSDNTFALRANFGVTVSIYESRSIYDNSTGHIDIEETVQVSKISQTSGLARNKLQEGDIFLSVTVGDKTTKITRTYHVLDVAVSAKVGDVVTFNILRNGQEHSVSMTVTAGDLKSC